MCAVHLEKGRQVVRWIYHILSGRCEKSSVKQTILDLPIKLLLRVFSFLSLPSQVCLAISSKRFHQLFGYVLEAEELRFPRMPRNRLAYTTTEQYNIRMALLIQLQNDDWACCGRCQRLHPSREFSAQQLVDYDPWNRTCTAWAGILDLCPCISLTVRDRMHIVKYLKSPKHRKSKLKCIDNGLLLLTGGQYLEHQCRAYPHVQISMQLCLTDHDELILDTQYEVPNLEFPWREMDGTMPLCCSQVWVDVFRHRDGSPWKCSACDACTVLKLPLPRSSADGFTVRVLRLLGLGHDNLDHYERQWYQQCRSLDDYIPSWIFS